MSYGGFPYQMSAIGSLFDEMTLIIERGEPRPGGCPLPEHAEVVALASPVGKDARRKISLLLRFPYYFTKICRHALRCDAVHTPLPGDFPLLGMLAAIVSRRPLIARYGGSWAATSKTTLMNRVTRTLMRRFAGGHNVMLATGEGEQPPAPGMHWIFSTALSRRELDHIQPDLQRGLAEPPRLVYIGRLSPEKGVPVLIGAIDRLRRDGLEPLPTVTLIGGGPQQRELQSLVRELNLESCFRFTGQLDRQSLSQQLLYQDICVQPSLTEGFSKAWLDAMAHGLPVLASQVGAAAGVLGDDGQRGWLTAPGDVAQLAGRIRDAVSQPRDWPALRRRCRQFVEQRTLEAWSQQIGELCASRWNMSLENGKLRPCHR
jgi:glycosyltransferase involved in cell wall biosynthesis